MFVLLKHKLNKKQTESFYQLRFNLPKARRGQQRMIDSLYCINVFSKKAVELIEFYHKKLEIPILNSLDDEVNGVNLGFIPDAPMICIWDANKIDPPVNGKISFVFMCNDLDRVCEELTQKGIVCSTPIRYKWGTYELRMRDPDDNEVVIVEQF
jgi:hypothetical protein